MGKFTLLGILAWIGGVLLLGFQGISTLMKEKGTWEDMALVDVVEPEYLNWITGLPTSYLQNAGDYLITMPLYQLLFGAGVLFFILGAFKRA